MVDNRFSIITDPETNIKYKIDKRIYDIFAKHLAGATITKEMVLIMQDIEIMQN